MYKMALSVGLMWLIGGAGLAVEISFQEGDLRMGATLVSDSYETDEASIRDSAVAANDNRSYVYGGTTTTDTRRMLFGFDLSYLNTLVGTNEYVINSVKFRMTKYNDNAGGTTTFDTHLIDAFDETTATWQDNNTYGASISSLSVNTGAGAGFVYEFSGSAWIDAVNNALNDASESLYFMSKRRAEVVSSSVNYAAIVDSGESGSVDERPELIVDITVLDPEQIITSYDFENHTAGALLPGPVGTARVDNGTKGDGPAFNYSQITSNCTVSTLDTAASNALDRTGCNVREDTIIGSAPGGKFLELSAASVGTASGEMIPNDPSGGGENALIFTVTPDAGYQLNLTALTWEMAVGRGCSDTGTIEFYAQGWYSLDGGANWIQMQDKVLVSNTEAQSFSGFTMQPVSLDVSVTENVMIALAVGDNSGRSAYVSSSVAPAAHYLDNITLFGTMENIPSPLPEGALAIYDFENHTAGALLGGAVGTARDSSEVGDGPDFNVRTNVAHCTVSTLSSATSNALDAVGCNVRADTIVGDQGYTQMLELNPTDVGTASGDLIPNDPAGGGENALIFTITPDEGYDMRLTGLSWDMGIGRGALDAGTVNFYAQGWYSLDGGSSWTKMGEPELVGNTIAASFAGMTTVSAPLSLAYVSEPVMIALAVGDNSGRSIYTSTSVSPVGFYLDNIQVIGTVSEAFVPPVLTNGMLATFNFENHLAGLTNSGPVLTPRPLSNRGDSFPYLSNGSASNAAVSALAEYGPADLAGTAGAYVCSDTLAIEQPGGNFLAISPSKLTPPASWEFGAPVPDIDPSDIALTNSFRFSVQPDSGKALNISGFSFDMAHYMATNGVADTNAVILRGQGWYLIPDAGVTNWTKMGDTLQIVVSNAQTWVGFVTESNSLSGVSVLQNQLNEVLIALSIQDNSGRSSSGLNSFSPAEHYIDNINLYGTVTDYVAGTNAIAITGTDIADAKFVLIWDSELSTGYNIYTNSDLVSGGWGLHGTIPGIGGSMSWTSSTPVLDQLFYKIEY
jgi:hypothetical protein